MGSAPLNTLDRRTGFDPDDPADNHYCRPCIVEIGTAIHTRGGAWRRRLEDAVVPAEVAGVVVGYLQVYIVFKLDFALGNQLLNVLDEVVYSARLLIHRLNSFNARISDKGESL